jgi:hypothetical protein
VVSLSDLLDHVRVVGDVGVGGPVKSAVAPAVVGVVALRGYHPVVPAQLLEADVEALLAALVPGVLRAVEGAPPHPSRSAGVRADHEERPVRIALLLRLGVEQVHVPVAATAAVHQEAQLLLAGLGQPLLHGLGQVHLLPPAAGLVQGQGHGVRGRLVERLRNTQRIFSTPKNIILSIIFTLF